MLLALKKPAEKLIVINNQPKLLKINMANTLRRIYSQKKFKNCVFCSWPQKKKDFVIAATEDYYLTINEYPYIEHHLLVVPFRHVVDSVDEPLSLNKEYLTKVAISILNNLGIADYIILERQGKRAGQSVSHIHRHIIPMDSQHDIFYKLADIPDDWDKRKLVSKYKAILKNSKKVSYGK